jgi:SOS response regulatory protein OraA/RecX
MLPWPKPSITAPTRSVRSRKCAINFTNGGLWTDAVENIITKLIEENYLNEERFAKAYVKGKFNQKAWGKIKIKQGLKLKNVSPVLIKKALLTIDASDYMDALTRLLRKKQPPCPRKMPTNAGINCSSML